MRFTLSLIASSLVLFGAAAIGAESAEARGFSPKNLRRAIKRRAPSRVIRYKRPTNARSFSSRNARNLRVPNRVRTARRAPTPFTAGRPIMRPAPLDTRRRYYTRQFPTGRRGYLHRPKNGLPAFGAPTATGRAPTMAERFYRRNQITANGAPVMGGRYASNARQARQATQARQARQYQQYRLPAWNKRR